MDARRTWLEGEGTEALLHHLRALEAAREARPPARERIEAALGPELTAMLLRALSRERRALAVEAG